MAGNISEAELLEQNGNFAAFAGIPGVEFDH